MFALHKVQRLSLFVIPQRDDGQVYNNNNYFFGSGVISSNETIDIIKIELRPPSAGSFDRTVMSHVSFSRSLCRMFRASSSNRAQT